MRFLAALLLALTFASPLAAQPGRVFGEVGSAPSEKRRGERLDGVAIHLRGTPHTVLSHSNGLFLFEDVPAGTYTLEATALGYDTLVVDVEVRPGALLGSFLMEREPFSCDDPGGAEDLGWQEHYFAELDPITRQAGLPLLREAPAERHRQEVRLWYLPSFGPFSLLRLVREHEHIEGEGYVGTALHPERDSALADRLREHFTERLRPLCPALLAGDSALACRTPLPTAPAWDEVLRRLEQRHVWALPDDSALPGDACFIGVDGWSLLVETHDGRAYRTYKYWSPTDEGARLPEELDAAGIAEVLQEVLGY